MTNNNKRKKAKQNKKTSNDTATTNTFTGGEQQQDDSKLIYVGGLVGFDESAVKPKWTLKQFREKAKDALLNSNRDMLYESPSFPLQEILQELLEEEVEEILSKEWVSLPETFELLLEENTFYIYRTDTNAVLARGVRGFENAKKRANELRKSNTLKWDQVKFKSERRRSNFGVSKSGKTYTDSAGNRTQVRYARNYNPSKRRHFRGGINSDGTSFDID
jgi:hypothetical protein